jgi:hypothetical protein
MFGPAEKRRHAHRPGACGRVSDVGGEEFDVGPAGLYVPGRAGDRRSSAWFDADAHITWAIYCIALR